MDRLRISSKLARIARMLIVANIVGDFRTAMLKADPSIDAGTLDEMSDFVKSCSSKSKIQKLASYCLVRGFLEWPGGKKDFDTVVRLFELVGNLDQNSIRSQSDYDRLAHPKEYPHDDDCNWYVTLLYGQKIRNERKTGGFNPDVEFKGKKYTDGVVTIYRLKEEPEEMQRVRRALDICVSVTANPWCLAARVDDDDPCFEPGSMNFERAWKMWRHYCKSPKRIAFKGGKPVAFYADELWWDMKDNWHDELPVQGAADDPEFLDEIESSWDIDERARKARLSDKLIREMTEDGQDVYAVSYFASRDDLPKSLIRRFSLDPRVMVRRSVALRDGLDEGIIRRLAKDSDDEVRRIIASNRYVPDDVLVELARDRDYEVQQEVSCRYDLSSDVILELLHSESDLVRLSVVENEYLPEEVIRWMAKNDPSTRVRKRICLMDDLPSDVIWILAKDPDSDVRNSIASRSGLSRNVILYLARDPDLEVRRRIVDRKEELPDNIRCDLIAKDARYCLNRMDGWDVIQGIRKMRDRLPDDAIREISKSGNEFMVKELLKMEGLPLDVVSDFVTSEFAKRREWIAGNAWLPMDFVRKLAADPEPDVREAIAGRSDLPEDLVRKLAADPESEVREKVSRSNAMPVDLIRQLAGDDMDDVRRGLARRADLPEDVIRQLAEDDRSAFYMIAYGKSSVPDDVMLDFIDRTNDSSRELIARKSNLSEAVIDRLMDDPSEKVRKALANNRAVSADALRRMLVSETSRKVRMKIRERLKKRI